MDVSFTELFHQGLGRLNLVIHGCFHGFIGTIVQPGNIYLLGNVEMMDETDVVVDIVIFVMDTRVGVLTLEFRT